MLYIQVFKKKFCFNIRSWLGAIYILVAILMSLKCVLNKNLVKFKVLLNCQGDSRARLLNYFKILIALNKLENKKAWKMLGNLKNSGGSSLYCQSGCCQYRQYCYFSSKTCRTRLTTHWRLTRKNIFKLNFF